MSQVVMNNWITIPGAARLVGVWKRTITYAIETGKIPVSRTRDGKILLKVRDVERWAKAPKTVGRPRGAK